MNFIVAGREDIENGIVVRTAYVVISITDPGTKPARISQTAGLRDVLRLQFHDAVPVTVFEMPPHIVLMNEDHANSIWQFALNWRDKVETIVVNCEQGMSRSPAVAAALCRSLDGDDRRFFNEYVPNRYIYDQLLTVVEDASGQE